MALDAHLATLEQRHSALDAQIHSANTSPGTRESDIKEMKRRKLHLKDEIERLRLKQ
ncbi:YdcH family protein [Mangrovibrevibacter kandeliae]|uniref:YdcH family protein n=1 Tax=Mangrovibrevibacter kandeliae TaxID=2968473 RepID=UPI0021195C97|nr:MULTISPECIES: DUF465 domain-containing protein [unclassified Aurantimonas]MCQ8783254.1 DUF465 domain-containing protein [Aurantimonas sp. CSK15Z-1]MCW4116231.1 DUF465 domain-containing protein [Aurantimonas sp. MSK8Z-1]